MRDCAWPRSYLLRWEGHNEPKVSLRGDFSRLRKFGGAPRGRASVLECGGPPALRRFCVITQLHTFHPAFIRGGSLLLKRYNIRFCTRLESAIQPRYFQRSLHHSTNSGNPQRS